MSNSNKSILCLLLVMLLTLGIQAWGQSQASTGQIAGTITDVAGATVPDASVKVTNTATGFTQTVTTTSDGLYRAVLLPPGTYTVEISKTGFSTSKANIDVNVGRTTEVNASLTVGGKSEEVTVTAEAIEVARHEAQTFVGATVIQSIPLNGGRFQDILNTTPAAQTDPSRGGISMTGQKMVNTGAVQIDGADYGQLFFGGIKGGERAQFAPTIPLDSIQEFQIVRAGYSAEFGRSTGGVISAVTKSGTNAIHGNGHYSIRPSNAGASNEFYDTISTTLAGQGCTDCVVNPNPTLQQWGGSVGGPVKKDKVFFFGAYDQQRQRIPHQVFFPKLVGFTPNAVQTEAFELYQSFQGPFEQTNDAYLFLIKGDYQINDKNRLSVRYNHSNYEGQNANSVGTSLSPTVTSALSNNGDELDRTRTVVGALDSYFAHFANEFRAQYAKEIRPRVANAQSPTVANSGAVGSYGTVSFLGQNEEHDYRVQLVDNVTHIRGSHTLKFGFEFNQLSAAQTFGFNQHGQFNFSSSNTGAWLTAMGNRWDEFIASTATPSSFYSHQLGNLQAEMSGKELSAFFQDSWKVFRNFTLNYGLRWEAQLNPKAVDNNAMYPLVNGFKFPNGYTENPAFVPAQNDQIAPRLGFAWDPKGDGKTVVRGFGGIYYAATPMLLYAATVNNFREPPGDLSTRFGNGGLFTKNPVPGCYGSLDAAAALNPATTACNTIYRMFNIVGIDLATYQLGALPDLTVDQVKQIAAAINTADGTAYNPYAGASPYFTENSFRNPRSYQAGFGVEREITPGLLVGVDGTWIKTVHNQRDRDLNLNPVPDTPCATSTSTGCIDESGRPIYNSKNAARPIPTLGGVYVRESGAKSLYRSAVFHANWKKKWTQVSAYYTLSENLSDDDQERNAT
ncbi:MAG TPA: carboxypeptidase regulatory-like domain-containing protein, partial [Terriglobales bacterium]|nr:carboxypeptidase regulatory-like domain-containing protein [Terriglobales bacterium]